jgi:peptide deformylase
MEVVVWPDPRLLKRTAPIERIDEDVRARVAEMWALMYADHGVGLAAPQVGWSVRLFVMNPSGDPARKDEERVLINPQLKRKAGKVVGEEGCLSFPGIYVEVERARHVTIEWTDLAGARHEEEWADWLARIFQHEHDHLENVLLYHRMSVADRMHHAEALAGLQRDFEEA